jgi:dolichol-phosphate mannosyltransferase
MTLWGRFAVFNVVGCAGVLVQLAGLFVLTHLAGVHYLPATAAAVMLAVVHNYLWHRRWTWRDRGGAFTVTFARFALWNGTVSLVGNLGVMATLVTGAGVPPVAANVVAIGVCGLVNFWLGDAVVFRRATGS